MSDLTDRFPPPESWRQARRAALDLLNGFRSLLWHAAGLLGEAPPDAFRVPPEFLDVKGEALPPSADWFLHDLAAIWVRSADEDPAAQALRLAAESLTAVNARLGLAPVTAGTATRPSAAGAILEAGRDVTRACETAFGCGGLVKIVRTTFPRDAEAELIEFDFALGAWRVGRENPEDAARLIPDLGRRFEWVRRLFTYPVIAALESVRIDPLCRWLWENYRDVAGNADTLRALLEMEFTEGIATVPPRPECRHSEDFRSVVWYGTAYSFTATQAAVVRQLWEAWENETPDVGHGTLLEGANSYTRRLPDLFRNPNAAGTYHPAWETMICPGKSKGTSRLADPA